MLRFVLVVISVITVNLCLADVKLPEKCVAGQPNILLANIVKKSEIQSLIDSKNWGQTKKTNKYWTAYSDRDNNKTYNEPRISSGEYSSLKFNETVRIAKIENNFALVYVEREKGLDYPHISTSAISKGWIPMSNLLLWSNCPTNDAGIYHKALVVINMDNVNDSSRKQLGRLYRSPESNEGSSKLRASMDFFFVMKESNGMVLLSREAKMSGYTDQVLYGWVNKNSFIEWNQRTCLEPNWKPKVVDQFIGKNITVYKDQALRNAGSEFPLGRKNNVVRTVTTQYRMGPLEMRYPLLDNDSNNDDIYKVTAFARPDGSVAVSYVPNGGDLEYGGGNNTTMTEAALAKKSIINLIVVIDGTSSMENFYTPTQKIIQQANEYFGNENKTVRVGIVIYRDYDDGEYMTEFLPMRTPTDPMVADFLRTGGRYGIKSSPKDHTLAEALYKGLELALDTKKMGYTKDNSNLMLVIGDCGNDLNDVNCITDEEIINRCVMNNVQVAAFQVRNNDEQSFLLFRQQMSKIVRENFKRQYGQLGNDVKTRAKEIVDGYDYITNLDKAQNFYIGSMRYANLNKVMDVNKLFDVIKDSYMQFADAIDASLAVINNVGDFFAPEDSESSVESTTASINKAYLGTVFSPEEIEALKVQNSLMAFEGYSKKKSTSDLDYWQPIVYISADEFAELIEKLRPVMAAANAGSTDRKPYIEAMKGLIRSMLPDITEEDLGQKDVKEVMALIAGLNAASKSLDGGRTLLEIQDEKIVPLQEFDRMISEFKNKFNKLDKIRSQSYPFSVKRNKETWYWIPVEDLP